MTRTIAAGFLILFLAMPVFAKSKGVEPKKGVYPVSCDQLWAAVKDTLSNKGNYALDSVNDLDLHASFTVIGDLIVYTNRVTLYEKNGGCAIDADIHDVGAENTNWREFHSRLIHSLSKMMAAKNRAPLAPGAAKSRAKTENP